MQLGVKTATLWSKSKSELEKQLEELKLELVNLRVQKISSGATSKLTKMYVWFCKAVSVYGFSECLGVWAHRILHGHPSRSEKLGIGCGVIYSTLMGLIILEHENGRVNF